LLAKARIYGRGFPLFPINLIIQCQEQGADYIVRYLTPIRTTRTRTGTNLCRATRSPRQTLWATVLSRPRRFRGYAKDAAAFPIWAAEPKLDERKRLGFNVLIFLIVYAGLFLPQKRRFGLARRRMLNLTCHRLASLQNQRV
jgi:Cytochrome C1 family